MRPKVRFYKDRNKLWRWRVTAANNAILANSGEGYFNRPDAKHGFDLIRQVLTDENLQVEYEGANE